MRAAWRVHGHNPHPTTHFQPKNTPLPRSSENIGRMGVPCDCLRMICRHRGYLGPHVRHSIAGTMTMDATVNIKRPARSNVNFFRLSGPIGPHRNRLYTGSKDWKITYAVCDNHAVRYVSHPPNRSRHGVLMHQTPQTKTSKPAHSRDGGGPDRRPR